MATRTSGPAGDAPLFPADSVVRRVDGERVLLLGGGRALLMQLAHPSVAKGVADHSDYRTDPTGRLHRTLQATYGMVFGTRADAERIARRLRAVHGRVRGPGYAATDPALAMWVHATLVDTSVLVHRRFLGGLDDDATERFYQESTVLGELFGVPRDQQPADWRDFRAYVTEMCDTLVVTDEARRVGRLVTRPRVPLVVAPLAEVGRQLTAGLLPARLRHQFGLSWDPARALALDAAMRASRLVLPRLPAAVRRAGS